MSRSFRHTPKGSIVVLRRESEKRDKRIANRRLRHRERQAVRSGAEIVPAKREVSNVWAMDKDGKRWYGEVSNTEYRYLLRK